MKEQQVKTETMYKLWMTCGMEWDKITDYEYDGENHLLFLLLSGKSLRVSEDKVKLTKDYDKYEMKYNEGKDTIRTLKNEIYSHKNTIHELQEVIKHYEPYKIIPIELTLEGIYNGCYKNMGDVCSILTVFYWIPSSAV